NSASGWIQAAGYSSLQLAALNNSGSWLLSTTNGSTADNISLSGSLTDSGTLQSAHALNMTASSADLSGKLLAAGDLAITTSGNYSNQQGAVTQSGGTLGLNTATLSNAGTLKANALNLTAGNGFTNSGNSQADNGNAVLRVNGTLSNSGTLFAGGNLDIADANGGGSESFSNSGTMQANGNLLLQATSASNSASGWIQAAGYSSLQLASLNNAGNWLLSTADNSQADNISLQSPLSNVGVLQSAHAFNLSANSVDNQGKLLAAGDLGLSLNGTLNNESNASIQSSGSLTVSGVTQLDNGNGALLAGNRLTVNAGTLNNSGTVQGGRASDSSLNISGSLSNSGNGLINMASRTGGAGTVTASSIDNSASLQSYGGLNVVMGSGGLSNSGTLVADQALNISGQGGNRYNVTANGTIQGGSLNITADTLSIGSGKAVQSQGDMNLDLNSLSFGNSSSRIVAARSGSGTGTLTLHNDLNNDAGIYSGGDFVVNATDITVGSNGGISALGKLTLNARWDVINSGALYAGDTLQLNSGSGGMIINNGTADGPLGSMRAGRLISLTASIIDNSSTIESQGDITLSAPIIHNDTYGGDTRYWGSPQSVSTSSVYTSQGYNGCGCVDQTEWTDYRKTWTIQQTYADGATTLNSKPQIIGAGVVTLQNFDRVTNLAGVISAGTLNLQGNSGASFVNDDLALQKRGYSQTWQHYIKYIAAGPEKYIDDPDHNNSGAYVSQYYPAVYSSGAGIYAVHGINGNSFSLSNTSSAYGSPSSGTGPNLGSGASLSSNAGSASGASAGNVVVSSQTTGNAAASASTSQGSSGLSAGSASLGQGATLSGSISFGGLHISLPTNPNGYFVPVSQPGAHYLIETNPLMGVDNNATGSNYLLNLLGFNPDTAQTRLGDASYETYLIQQQLIAQTGNNLLKGYASQNAEIQKLMQNAASDAKTLGLTLGQAPSAQQLASLKQDIVWMVSTTVNGQSVLVPQVFLAPATIASIQSGAVIASSNINLKLDALNNTGGTISGSKSLDISSKGDITNTSGTISGGNVNLASTNGSIVNQTLTQGSGNDKNFATSIGKQASISATGNLGLTAAKDISNLGANVSAGGNASLAAKGNVTFDTLQDKTVSTTSQSTSTAFNRSSTSSTVTTVKQIKSGLSVGGNLDMAAGKDITLAGTDASVGGNAKLDAKGSVQLLDRTDTTTTHTVTSQSGLGVGGGLFGTSVTTTDTSKGNSVGSSLKVKGDATLNAGADITLRGSTLDVAGSGSLNASNVQVLAGQNYETRQEQTNTTTFFKIAGPSTSSKTGAQSNADSTSSASKGLAKASAGANASANASGQASAGLALMSNTQTTSTDSSSNSVASSLRIGKNGNINAAQNIDIAGSTLKAGGDLQLNAQQVDIRAAENKSTHSSTTTETTVGLMTKVSGDADASAKADASAQAKKTAIGTKAAAAASADANANGQANLTLLDITATKNDSSTLTHSGSAVSGGNVSINAGKQLALTGSQLSADKDMQIKAGQVVVGTVKDVSTSSTQRTDVSIGLMASSNNNANAGASVDTATVVNASAGASASASSNNKLTLLKAVTGTDSSLDVVNQGSQIKAGGNLKLDAGKQLDVTGSGIAAGGNADLKADSQHFNAAQDVHQSSSSSNTTTAGLYLDASTGANATGKVMAETGASAMVGAGYYVNNSGSSSMKGSTTAVVSQLSAGGDMSRTASKDIVDTGTAISAGGNFRQSATTITSKAASDASYSSSSQQNSEGRVGMYAGASASATVSGGAAADASVGGSISAKHDDAQSTSNASTARVSTIKVGGDFSSNSSQATSLEGSRISSGGNVDLKAGSLDYRAAQNTSSTTGTQANAAASLQVNVNAEHVVGGELSMAGGGGSSQSRSSTAVVGGISSGGGMNITVKDDASFAGTALSSKGDVNVNAGGKVNFAAANSTSQATSRDASASFSAGGSTGGGVDNKQNNGMVSAAANYSQSDSQSTSKTAATLQSGGAITVRSGGDMNLEGSKLNSKGDATLAAGGQLTISAAHDTASTQKIGAGLSAGGSGGSSTDKGKETKEASVSVGLSGEYGQSQKDSASVATLNSGGKLKLSAGQDIKLEGTALKAGETVSTQAGGQVIKQKAVSSSSGVDLSAGATVTLKKKTTNDTAANDTTKTQTDRDKQAALAKEAADVVNKKKTSGTNSLSNAGDAISKAANQPESSLLDKAKNSKLGQAADKVITKGKELKDKIPVRVGDLQGGGSLQLENSTSVDVSITQGKDKPN
ncbi:hemagglutinin repeat-containing protein, partial [Aquitalea pelogenes]|uniref:hemagglutinin repeat-containing protein n=1 Tax=Aquitalea pelogenes TaxID=1293573 RepID=UPI0035B1E3DE